MIDCLCFCSWNLGIASDEIKGRVVEATLADLKDNSADKFWYAY